MGVTHDITVRCLSQGNRSVATPPDLDAATIAVVASIPRVYVVWYPVLPAQGSPPLPPQHLYPPRGGQHHNTGVARGPRARAGVAAAPQGFGFFFAYPDPGVRAPGGRPPRLR